MIRVVALLIAVVLLTPEAQLRIRLRGQRDGAEAANPIASDRHAQDAWQDAGVEGGIPTRTTACYTDTGGLDTAAQINTQIDACAAGQVVQLQSGTYNLSAGIDLDKGVTLRGNGADATKLVFSAGSNNCGYFDDGMVSLCESLNNHYGGTPTFDNSANWTAGYTKGTTVITLASVTGLVAGMPIQLDQNNDSSDGYPATGDLYVCSNTSNSCSTQGGGGNAARSGRAQVSFHTVVAVNGNDVTIDPAVYTPNIRSGQDPEAWWSDDGTFLEGAGLEDVSIDFTSAGTNAVGVFIANCMNCWARGVRVVTREASGGSEVYQFLLINAYHVTIKDNYLYGPGVNGNQRYSMSLVSSSQLLIENNIFHTTTAGAIPNGPTLGSVVSYNFVTGATYSFGGTQEHGVTLMNLYEGNNMQGLFGDIIHGPHYFITAFRNHFDRDSNNPATNVNTPFKPETHSRFWNAVGNVLGDGSATTYQTTEADCSACIWNLGWEGDGSGTPTGDDSNVARTLFRWGNWDTERAATSWCGNSSNTGWVAVCGSATEVPSGISNYPNAIPSAEAIPNSLYLSAKPAFFQSITWPPIGPDVTGGAISGYGSHAHKIPARVCFESMSDDGDYTAATVRSFNRVTCYGS